MEKEYFQTNQTLWDHKTPVHAKSEFYQMEAFKKGQSSLRDIELALLPDLRGKKVLHLQCHFGQDTLSMARMGAHVTGVDFSGEAIKLARSLNAELGLEAEFVACNVYDLKDHLDGQFDYIFTSYGTITWLPDLDRWAEVIQHFLKPGGTFLIVEFHPAFYMFDSETHRPSYAYFNPGKPYEETIQGTYADTDSSLKDKEYFWCHALSEIFTALLAKGLQVRKFEEYDYSPYDCFPNLTERKKGEYVYDHFGVRIPHVFALEMSAPV